MTKLTTIFLVLFSCLCHAQVTNNSIHDRVELVLEGDAILSDTEHSTVEENCINKSLTNKCLVYHNDQWFYFSVRESGKYYLNISRQECRRNLGLQLILIEGNPCEISTYRIKTCIDRIPQEDIYVPLDSLAAGVRYLVNIDGFLNDFCTFNIRLSTGPEGFHYQMPVHETADVQWSQPEKKIVDVTWQVNDSSAQDYTEFVVMRQKQGDAKARPVHHQPLIRNAYGALQLTYSATDTLQEFGVYRFSVIGKTAIGDNHRFSAFTVSYQQEWTRAMKQQRIVVIPLAYKRKALIEVYVFDRFKETLLRKFEFFADPRSTSSLAVDLGKYIDNGYSYFLVELQNRRDRSIHQYPYRLDEAGLPVQE